MNTRAAIKTPLEGRTPRVPDVKLNLIGESRSSSLQALSRIRREAGFTMAEIAIALGVIAFALIAIIGILPTGLQTQRDNREETIVNQDARLLLEAIKGGGRDVTSDIGSYVRSIDEQAYPTGVVTSLIIEKLSDSSVSHTSVLTGVSGNIASRGDDLGFHYQVISTVLSPLSALNNPPSANVVGGAGEFADSYLSNQIYEVRLRFAWPVQIIPNPPPADRIKVVLGSEANRYTVRTLIAGRTNDGVIYAQEYYRPAP